MKKYTTIFVALIIIALVAWISRREFAKDLSPVMEYIDEHDQVQPFVLLAMIEKAGIELKSKQDFLDAITKRGSNKNLVKDYIKTL